MVRPTLEDTHVGRRDWIRRNGVRMSLLAMMCMPFLMGADCDDTSSSEVVDIVAIAVDAILTIIFLFA